MQFNLIRHKHIFLSISGALVFAAVLFSILFGFRQGIDFTGGTLWQFTAEASVSELKNFLSEGAGIAHAAITQNARDESFLVRLPDTNEADHQKYLALLKNEFPGFQELGFQSIGPSIGRTLRRNALVAMVLVLVGISLYIAFAFRRVSRPVASWKYGLVTLATLFHDVLIPAGLLTLLGRIGGVEIDSNFVVALLVVAGFSVHDTIVVFDRIRENLSLDRGRSDFGEVVNRSVNQTFARSVNTSLTLILVLIALLAVGPSILFYFILTLLVGVTVGTYSSIFVASPALLLFSQRKKI